LDPIDIGLIGAATFVLITFLRVPIAYGMFIVGLGGLMFIYPLNSSFQFLPTGLFSYTSNFSLAALPLFILMGHLAFYADIGKDAYDAAKAWVGRVPGGLGVGTVYSSALFGAVSGSSLSEVAVFSKIAVPEMIKAGYSKRLATGVVASAGCLGVLIPPSILLIFYGILTETSIGQLFIAGIVPGILYAVIMASTLMLVCTIFPNIAPRSSSFDTSWVAKIRTLKNLWSVLLLFVIVLGAIYTGWATPDEAAAVGVMGSLLIVFLRGKLSLSILKQAAIESAKGSAMIFLLLGAGSIFATFLSSTGVVGASTSFITGLDIPFWALMVGIVVLYLLLGCFLDAISMMVLTMPLIVPLIEAHDMSLVWFGVVVTMMMAVGAITPPMGLNCFVMKGALGDQVELKDIFLGATPFVFLMLFTVGLFVAFPDVVLWLPEVMRSMR
jgi:tripartite ATP-independent transporter DctM subunit